MTRLQVLKQRRAVLEQRLFENRSRVQHYGWGNPDQQRLYADEHLRDLKQVRHDERDLAATIADEEREIRWAPIAAILCPRTRDQVARAFVWDLAQSAIEFALDHRIQVLPAINHVMSASTGGRSVRSEPVLTERSYIQFMHEAAGHCLEPRADGLQQRHVFDRGYINSPLAECAAWLAAIRHTYRDPHDPDTPLFTAEMYQAVNDGLSSYRERATASEKEKIAAVIGFAFGCIVPAPDTPQGRERIVSRIASETPPPRLQRALQRLADINREDRVSC